MGRRVGAWVVDALLFVLLVFLFNPVEGPFAKYEAIPEGWSGSEACEEIQDIRNVNTCVVVDDRVYYVGDAIRLLGMVAAVVWFLLVYGVWQGTTGATPGKTLLKVRVVNAAGTSPGIGKSLVRSLLWIVDGAPWVVPLVGFVTGLISTGHQRIGDRVAKTFVVGIADVGRPVSVAAAAPATPGPVYHSPQPTGPSGAPTPMMPPTAPPTAPPTLAEPVTPASPTGPPAGLRQDDTLLPPFEPARPPFPAAGPAPAPPTREPMDERPAPPGGAASGRPNDPEPAAEQGEGTLEGMGTSGAYAPPSWAVPPGPARSDPFGRPEPPAAPAPSPGPGAEERPSPPTSGTSEPTLGAPSAEPAEPAGSAEPAEAVEESAGPEAAAPPMIPVEPTRPPIEPEPEPAPPTYEPQWDAARGAYIQWDPNRSSWLQWDDDAKEWNAIS